MITAQACQASINSLCNCPGIQCLRAAPDPEHIARPRNFGGNHKVLSACHSAVPAAVARTISFSSTVQATLISSLLDALALICQEDNACNLCVSQCQSICVQCLCIAASAEHLRFDLIQAPRMASERPCVSAR